METRSPDFDRLVSSIGRRLAFELGICSTVDTVDNTDELATALDQAAPRPDCTVQGAKWERDDHGVILKYRNSNIHIQDGRESHMYPSIEITTKVDGKTARLGLNWLKDTGKCETWAEGWEHIDQARSEHDLVVLSNTICASPDLVVALRTSDDMNVKSACLLLASMPH